MDSQIEILIKSTADKAIADLKKTEDGVKKVGASAKTSSVNASSFATSLKSMAGALGIVATSATAVRMAINFVTSSVSEASDAVEMAGKFNVVFGETAAATTKRIEELADQVNRSHYSLMEMASSLQDTFVPLGFARREAADLSVELTKLVVDVASFNNAMESDVARDFQSAVVGNGETVKKYGIILNETTMKAELEAMGVEKLNGVYTEQEKVMARINILMKGTSDAQGDAIRTADQHANTVRALADAWKDYKVAVGDDLLEPLAFLNQGLAVSVEKLTDLQKATSASSKGIKESGQEWERLIPIFYAINSATRIYSELTSDNTDYIDEHRKYLSNQYQQMQKNVTGTEKLKDSTLELSYAFDFAAQKSDLLSRVGEFDFSDIEAKQASAAQTTGEGVHGALGRYLWGGGEKFKEAEGIMDEVLGTTFGLEREYDEKTKAAARDFAITGDAEGLKASLMEIQDIQLQIDGADEAVQQMNDMKQAAIEAAAALDGLDGSYSVKIKYMVTGEIPEGTISQTVKNQSQYDPDHRASGGSVMPYTPYIVGEQGPELFVPGVGGQIVNNKDSKKLGGDTFKFYAGVTFVTQGEINSREILRQMG